MKYTEIGNVAEEHILESPYEEVINPCAPKAYTFIHNSNFYKLFLLFMIGSIFGCYMEQIQYYLHKSIWECRAGVIWGPFSEIYGFGAVLMFLLSQKVKDKSPLIVFSIATVCGSAFEYIARLFQEIMFGSITWDYSGQLLSIGGRTSLKYGICWGLLGLVFIKIIFPITDKLIENIRGKIAFLFTWALIIFMLANLLFSAIAVNRWGERLQGVPSEGHMDECMDYYYGDDKMENIFPHMRFVQISQETGNANP
jgi:uncharacterized membrane protein